MINITRVLIEMIFSRDSHLRRETQDHRAEANVKARATSSGGGVFQGNLGNLP